MTPFAIWTEMFLKSGQRVLDSMATMAKEVRRASVEVIPTRDAPRRKRKASARRASRRRSR